MKSVAQKHHQFWRACLSLVTFKLRRPFTWVLDQERWEGVAYRLGLTGKRRQRMRTETGRYVKQLAEYFQLRSFKIKIFLVASDASISQKLEVAGVRLMRRRLAPRGANVQG
jgi:hypothetical protein